MNNVLIIEDHKATRNGLVSLIKNHGYQVEDASNGFEAESMITGNKYDLIIVDLILPQGSGLQLLKKVKEISPGTEVIIITGHETIDSAIHAMKLGAHDYLLKPLEPKKIINIINQAIEKKTFVEDSSNVFESLNSPPYLIGRSKQMIKIFKLLAKTVNTDNPIMITGEAGTGKETIAQAIHQNSLQKDHPFIVINCSLIPDNLSEEQAFHYLKVKILESSEWNQVKNLKATLYLKNIDSAPQAIQSNLLFFLDNHSFTSDMNIPFMENLRFISSSRKNLKKLVEKKLFRQNLFFRLNTISISIPAIRERKVDIPLLANHFLNKYASSISKSLSPEVLKLFLKYQWPGNVQELKNIIEYAVIMSPRKQITLAYLPSYLRDIESFLLSTTDTDHELTLSLNKELTLKELEKMYILKKLEIYRWDQKKTATYLGIGRTTLWRKLKQYGITPPSGTQSSN